MADKLSKTSGNKLDLPSGNSFDHLQKQALRHFTESQLIIIGVQLGLPIAAFILLWLINPAYERELFRASFVNKLLLTSGIVAEILNGLILYFGFRLINLFLPIEHAFRIVSICSITILTLLLFTFPVLWIVFFGPAMLILANAQGL